MIRYVLGTLLFSSVALSVNAQTAPAKGPSGLAPLEFLLGEWVADAAKPDDATGRTTFAWGLQDHVIVRTNYASYPASERNPASRHDDLMVIYVGEADEGIRADYYDSEGHVIRYAVRMSNPRAAEFLSDAEQGAPRYRLTYELTEGGLAGKFEVAPPGRPDAFSPYLSWKSHKVSD